MMKYSNHQLFEADNWERLFSVSQCILVLNSKLNNEEGERRPNFTGQRKVVN